jgi:hypothetical protein
MRDGRRPEGEPMTDEPSRPEELPMEAHHLLAEEAIGKRKGRIGNSFRSAFRHIRLAWKLHPFDNEMSLFRAITGEEEAASGLMLAFIQQRYPGANKLKPRDHTHKAAVSPYLDAVNNLMASVPVPAPKLSLSMGSPPSLSISVDLRALGVSDEPNFATPDNPFNFSLRKNGEKSVYFFEKELAEIAGFRGSADIRAAISEKANLRNRLLYASDDGIPTVEFPDETLIRYRDRIYRLCLLTIGILQTKQHQLFAVQNLEAFLTALGHIVESEMDYDLRDGQFMSVIQQPDGSYKSGIGYRAKVTITARFEQVWQINVHSSGIDPPGSA